MVSSSQETVRLQSDTDVMWSGHKSSLQGPAKSLLINGKTCRWFICLLGEVTHPSPPDRQQVQPVEMDESGIYLLSPVVFPVTPANENNI